MWYLFAVSMILALIGFFQSYYQQTEDLELCLNRKLKVLFKTFIMDFSINLLVNSTVQLMIFVLLKLIKKGQHPLGLASPQLRGYFGGYIIREDLSL